MDSSSALQRIAEFEQYSSDLVESLKAVEMWVRFVVPKLVEDIRFRNNPTIHTDPWDLDVVRRQAIEFIKWKDHYDDELRFSHEIFSDWGAEGFRIANAQFSAEAKATISHFGQYAHEAGKEVCLQAYRQAAISSGQFTHLDAGKLFETTLDDLYSTFEEDAFDRFDKSICSFDELRKAIELERGAIIREERRLLAWETSVSTEAVGKVVDINQEGRKTKGISKRGRREDPERDERIWRAYNQDGLSREQVAIDFDLKSASSVTKACQRHEKRQEKAKRGE